MPDIDKRDDSVVTPMRRKTERKIHNEMDNQKKEDIKHRHSKAEQKGLKETYERMAEQENRKREEINKIIKKQGYYNGPNGEHYELKLKKVNADYFAKQQGSTKVRPTRIKRTKLLNKLDALINKIFNKIANFFANRPDKNSPEVSQPSGFVESGDVFAGTKKKDISYNSDVIVQSNNMTLGNNIYQQEEKPGIADAKREFQLWMNRNREYKADPRDLVFDYMKAATLQGLVTDEKGITDILSYAMDNKCEYEQNSDTVLMYFQMKNGDIGAIGIDAKGNIFVPETINQEEKNVPNPITAEKMGDKIPEKVLFMSEQIKNSQNLLRQFSNENGFSKDSLQQVREYLDSKNNSTYEKHLQEIESKFVDRNAIAAINEFITRVAFIGQIQDVNTAMNVAVIRPSMVMNQMANPGQYTGVFNQAYDQLAKGMSIDDAFAVAETMLIPKDNELVIVSRETQELIAEHIDELQKHGASAKDVIGVITSYNQSSIEMAQINKQLISFELANGSTIQDVISTPRDTEVNIESIAERVNAEMSKASAETVIDDARNNTQSTITGIYLSNLKQQDILLVAEKLPEGYVREGFMVAAGLMKEEFIPTSEQSNIAPQSMDANIIDDSIEK